MQEKLAKYGFTSTRSYGKYKDLLPELPFSEKLLVEEIETIETLAMEARLKIYQVGTRNISDDKDLWRWNRLNVDLMNSLSLEDEMYEETEKRLDSDDKLFHDYSNILGLGIRLRQWDITSQSQKIAKKNQFFDELRSDFDIANFASSSPLMIACSGVTLEDFRGFDKKKDPLDYFRFMLTLSESVEREDYLRILAENDNPNLVAYPEFSLHSIEQIRDYLSSIIFRPAVFLRAITSKTRSMGSEEVSLSILEAIKGANNMKLVQEITRKSLLDPKSKDFSRTRDLFDRYINGDLFQNVIILNTCGLLVEGGDGYFLDTPDTMFYRAAERNIEQGKNVELLKSVNSIKRQFVENFSPDYLRSRDDLEEIYDLDAEIIRRPITSREVNDSFNRVRRSANVLESDRRDLDTSKIDWLGFIKPTIAEIAVDKKLMRGSLFLSYENDQLEKREFRIVIDAKSGIIDSSLLDDLNSKGLENFRDDIYMILKAVFCEMSGDISNSSSLDSNPKIIESEKKAKRVYDPEASAWYKKARSNDLVDLVKPSDGVTERISSESGIKRVIVLPTEQSDLDKLFNGMSRKDIDEIITRIEQHNETGVGLIIPCRKVEQDVETLFKFRVGKKRLVLMEVESESGQVIYQPIAAGFRKDIYRNVEF